jgi:hypothetical protein
MAVAAVAIVAGNVLSAYAAVLTSASLSLSDPRTGQTASYTFSASDFSATAECIVLEFNTAADGSGGVPAGLDSTGAALSASGTMVTESNWTLDATANGTLELTYSTGETPANAGTRIFTGVDNGSTEATTYYALFNTYSDDTCTTAVDEVVVAFLYSDGELVSLTIEPTLTFTVNTVAGGVNVNGATTTVASGGTGIDFGNNVTAVANGVSAHRLDVTTNADGGFVVYIRHNGDLTNQNSNTISVHSGTNGSPTAFPAAGTEGWGYTTEDSSLTGGTADRFTNPGNVWAGFTTANAPVMDNPNATAGTQQTEVGHQVGISASTEAGSYSTILIYTVVSTY